ncbi:MAG: hypothetical protein ACRDXX_01750, partial [Stackebrandtia sp.]
TLFRLYLDMARLDDAHLLLEEVKRTPDSSGSDRKQIYVLLLQGQLHRRTGQFTSGRLALTQALELVRERGRHGLAREIQDALAQLLSDSGQHRPALDCLNTPAGDRHHLLPRDAARRALIRCEIHARLGECGQAVSWGLQALDLYAAMPDPLQHARGLEALADAHAGLGDVHAAGDCRRRALEIFTRLDAPDAKQLQALLKTV